MRARTYSLNKLSSRFPSLAVSGYQRAVVWSYPQRASLIRSLLESYPTGLIVLNRIAERKSKSKKHIANPYLPRVEIIDGQQRLTTIFDFLQNPTLYFTTWAPRVPTRVEEPPQVRAVRDRLEPLYRELRKPKAKYAPPKTSKSGLMEKISNQALQELALFESGNQVQDAQFHELVKSLSALKRTVGQRSIVIEELEGLSGPDAERIYDVINSSGTSLKWWELLWGKQEFVHTPYNSSSPYRTTHNEAVERSAVAYRLKHLPRSSPIKAVPPDVLSLWHSMYALSQHCYNRFSLRDPQLNPTAPQDALTKPKVDGLGFRLVSTFLSHDVSRAAIYDLLREYSVDEVRQTIDILFDTADVVFSLDSAGDFQFFVKYASFTYDALPAYPLLGLFTAAAKMVAANKVKGEGIKLTSKDTAALRALTEEMFRDAICTQNWAGTGDTRLKEWLDSHFDPVAKVSGESGARFPGTTRPMAATKKTSLWRSYLDSLGPTGRRSPDRRVAAFHFWVQYILDSNADGTLPRGTPNFDHIVPFNPHYPQTTHPLNLAAISADLNRAKGNLTYNGWKPEPSDDQRYRRQVACQPTVSGVPASACADFLAHANFTDVNEMLDERRKVFDFVLTSYLTGWISDGDIHRPG